MVGIYVYYAYLKYTIRLLLIVYVFNSHIYFSSYSYFNLCIFFFLVNVLVYFLVKDQPQD